jgi:acyl carrier protein
MATVEEICQIVAQHLGRKSVAPEDRILEDLGAESLDVVNIIATLEDRYELRIHESELPELNSAEALFERVQRGA